MQAVKSVVLSGVTAALAVTCAAGHPGGTHTYGSGTPGASAPNGWISEGVVVLGHMPVSSFPGATSGNDCWGYVSPSGREYALMGVNTGIGVVEVTDPMNPVMIGFFAHGTSMWHDVKVVGDWAYAVTEGGGGIRVIDLRQADQGVVTSPGSVGSGPTHNIAANEESGYIYRTGGGTTAGTNGIHWYNAAANPAAPVYEGGLNTWYVHDAQVVTWTEAPFAGREIAFLYSGSGGNGSVDPAFRILDVTNKSNPVLLGELRYSGRAYCHQGWLTEDRRYVYLDDELDEQQFGWNTRTRIIDVQDLTNPVEVGYFSSGVPAIDHNQYTHNGYVYQANYRSGLRVFEYASDPLAPVQVAFLDTFPANDAANFDGAWSVYPYFPSGTIVVSDIQQGMILCKVLPNRLEFSYPDGLPERIDPAGGTMIRVQVNEVRRTLDASQVVMMFDDGGMMREVAGAPTGVPGEFVFTTLRVLCSTSPRYAFRATAVEGDEFLDPPLALMKAEDWFSTTVASDIAVTFHDDFEQHLGWTVTNIGGLTDGAWQRGIPANGNRGDPPTDADGSGQCYLTANRTGNSDVDNGSTILTSPAMDATGNSYISYWRWYHNSFGAAPFEDIFVVEVSNNNGATWTTLEIVGPDGPEVSGGWFRKTFRIRDVFATPSSQFRIRFNASDLGQGSVVEAAVDGVEVFRIECEDAPVCAADLSGSADPNDPWYGVPDGIVDASDFFYYLDQFVSGGIDVADLTGSSDPNDASYGVPDGVIDAADFFYYLDLFVAGCP
ncbi:MAG: choice-of-anchor B family protein [Phycisphaeraceae bacterium]|nr:choice-of-anchor B family protein [Phycisphaeraceae bacterium]